MHTNSTDFSFIISSTYCRRFCIFFTTDWTCSHRVVPLVMMIEYLRKAFVFAYGRAIMNENVISINTTTDQEEAAKVSEVIRKATSRPIRQKYPELWKMPSLWNQSPRIVEGKMDSENMEKIEDYYRRLKTR